MIRLVLLLNSYLEVRQIKQVFQNLKGISEKVADYIKEQIQNGKFKVGERIPGERDMALELNVSRNTVREAYKILEAYGYLIARHGTGFFIAPESEQIRKMMGSFILSNSQVNDLFDARRLLEEKIVELAAINRTEEQVKKLEEIVLDANRIASGDGSYVELSGYDSKFHLYLAKMSGNEIIYRIMHHLIDLLAKARSHSIQIPKRAKKSIMEHAEILKAIKDGNDSLAKVLMKEHLDSVENSMREYYDL